MKKHYGCIYKTTNLINGKIYIGQTTKSERVLKGTYKGSGTYLGNAINKYGYNNFIVELICYAKNKDQLDELEKQYIINFNSIRPSGYNLMQGGGGGNSLEFMSYEERKEFCNKVSVGSIGRILSENHKNNIGKSCKNVWDNLSKEKREIHSNKLRIANINKIHSEETKNKLRKFNLGKSTSEITKNKISIALINRPKSEDSKKKIKNYSNNRSKIHIENLKLSSIRRWENYRKQKSLNNETI